MVASHISIKQSWGDPRRVCPGTLTSHILTKFHGTQKGGWRDAAGTVEKVCGAWLNGNNTCDPQILPGSRNPFKWPLLWSGLENAQVEYWGIGETHPAKGAG